MTLATPAFNAEEFVADVQSDRRNWRFLVVPQLVFIFTMLLFLAIITIAGMYSSVSAF